MASATLGVRRSSKPLPPKLPSFPDFKKEQKVIEVEVREDEEQEKKYYEIVDLLLAAGYFRARIKGLTPFDKVIGGMTWCIEICNIDVDIDLLYQENLIIGQKISLTEKIVAVLPKMKCPHSLEPHQIQGLDFIHIFPVVQWLVKKAIETREETGDYIRAFSISQFNKHYSMPEDVALKGLMESMSANYKELKDIYGPQRKYRHHAPDKIKDEESRVQTTLLEYGMKLESSEIAVEKQQLQEGEHDHSLDQKVVEKEKKIQSLMKEMATTSEHEGKLSASSVGSIVNLQSGEIQQIASEFAEKQAELISEGKAEKRLGGAEYHKKTLASLSNQLKEKQNLLTQAEEKHTELKTMYRDSQTALTELKNSYSKMIEEMQVLQEAETDDNKSVLAKLMSLVAMNESLKKQEQEFRTHCKEEMNRLKGLIEEIKESSEEGNSEDDERTQLIEKQYGSAKEKLQKIRVLVAKKNREIAILQRKIDEVPSRVELSQYQKRFVELYNQVAAKHKETKQFYTLYNTLEDTRIYLNKEVDLLNSIQDNFTEAMSSSASKEQFLAQLEQIVDTIELNKQKLEKKKENEKSHRDQINDQLLGLVDKQRHYFKTVKDFKEECRKNEILVAKLKDKGK